MDYTFFKITTLNKMATPAGAVESMQITCNTIRNNNMLIIYRGFHNVRLLFDKTKNTTLIAIVVDFYGSRP